MNELENLLNFNDNGNVNDNDLNANNQEENQIENNEPLASKISIRDFTDIMRDIIISICMIAVLFLPYFFSPSYCDLNIYLSMKTLSYVYVCFIIKGFIRITIIYFNKRKKIGYQIFLYMLDLFITICYYVSIYFAYIIFSKSNPICLKLDTFTILTFFSIIFVGIVSFVQDFANIAMLTIYFFLLIDYFVTNPIYFFSHYGVDPEIIKNLPAFKADENHLGCCAICLKDIKIGDPILILSCPGKHYFHEICIKDWLLIKTTCPMCRCELILY